MIPTHNIKSSLKNLTHNWIYQTFIKFCNQKRSGIRDVFRFFYTPQLPEKEILNLLSHSLKSPQINRENCIKSKRYEEQTHATSLYHPQKPHYSAKSHLENVHILANS